MSTISAGLNALTSATLVDFYQRIWKPNVSSDEQLHLAKYLTVGYGVLVLGLAFVVSKLGTLLEASNKAVGLVGGPLLGLFLLGMLNRRADGRAAMVGWAAGVVALIPIAFVYTSVSFLWYAMVGCLVTMGVGALAGLFLGRTPKDLDGLVFDSRYLAPEETEQTGK
jgi:sodium-coupled monocarboxylate transporter 8/12